MVNDTLFSFTMQGHGTPGRVVDKNKYNPDGSLNANATRIIYDGRAGDLDGQVGNGVTIAISPSPVYVELYP